MANIGWQNWSEFGEVGVSLGNAAATSLDMDAGDAPVNQFGGPLRGDFVGEMDSNDFHFFALNLNWNL